MNRELESQVSELVSVSMECNKSMVQMVAIAGAAALGCTAIFVDGDIGMTIAVAIAAAMGGVVGWLFPSPLSSGGNDD